MWLGFIRIEFIVNAWINKDRKGLKTSLWLDRSEIVRFGYKLRNDSEKCGLVPNELQFETIARVLILRRLLLSEFEALRKILFTDLSSVAIRKPTLVGVFL